MGLYSDKRRNLSDRLQLIRIDRFGEGDVGIAALAEALGLDPDTWRNFEGGVAMPSEILVELMELTRVRHHWLATGQGPRYARTDPDLRFFSEN